MGNDGSGWSMPVWPRHIDRTGQDSRKPSKESPPQKLRRKENCAPVQKGHQDKFEVGLTAAIGPKAAQAYIRRKKRREAAAMLVQATKENLALLRKRLASIEAGNVWESDHPGPYTLQEKAQRVAALKTQILQLEANLA